MATPSLCDPRAQSPGFVWYEVCENGHVVKDLKLCEACGSWFARDFSLGRDSDGIMRHYGLKYCGRCRSRSLVVDNDAALLFAEAQNNGGAHALRSATMEAQSKREKRIADKPAHRTRHKATPVTTSLRSRHGIIRMNGETTNHYVKRLMAAGV